MTIESLSYNYCDICHEKLTWREYETHICNHCKVTRVIDKQGFAQEYICPLCKIEEKCIYRFRIHLEKEHGWERHNGCWSTFIDGGRLHRYEYMIPKVIKK